MWSLAAYPERLGHSGLSVPAMGLRCIGMSEFDGVGDEQESSATIPQRSNLLSSIRETQSLTLFWQMLNLRELHHNSST
jgi:hypothetical protein